MSLIEKRVFMTMTDVKRMEDPRATGNTHLARYESAFDAGKGRVLDVRCPECGAPTAKSCFRGV